MKDGLTWKYGETRSRDCGSWGTGVFQGGGQQGPVGRCFVARDEQVLSLPLREEARSGRQVGAILGARSLGGAFVDYGSELFLLGLGYGPIYPSQLHRIPDFFGKTYAADIIGFHMAGAYAMGLLAQVSIGYIASRTSFAIIPYMLAVLCTLLLVLNKRLLSIIAKKKREKEETLAVEIQDQ